jgi:hypothetical protein
MRHQIEVSKVVAATPEQVYAVVSDLPSMGRFSPENTGGRWVKGATGPAVGAKFEGTNALGWKKWKTLATVTAAQPGTVFAFDVVAAGCKVAGWGFAMEPVDGGTNVTHFWDDHRNPVMAKLTGLALGVKDRAVHNQANMQRTLDGIADTL